ncbi:hypothetical protein NADFUDRAFT_52116 [Nadsonia fulvescens var. elongata DSM 6958]|uniref:Uncharacterized protein n=1 Tax=Nadsonia fulvescens var. elongata DSM 6958 TaxID=857566 RepID=A0A1E3PGH2_9ASCO|nr:hypothetical protein NADFUDRAFT_52116 [Nadsonia fulvescens var. elongata DSM 6958]
MSLFDDASCSASANPLKLLTSINRDPATDFQNRRASESTGPRLSEFRSTTNNTQIGSERDFAQFMAGGSSIDPSSQQSFDYYPQLDLPRYHDPRPAEYPVPVSNIGSWYDDFHNTCISNQNRQFSANGNWHEEFQLSASDSSSRLLNQTPMQHPSMGNNSHQSYSSKGFVPPGASNLLGMNVSSPLTSSNLLPQSASNNCQQAFEDAFRDLDVSLAASHSNQSSGKVNIYNSLNRSSLDDTTQLNPDSLISEPQSEADLNQAQNENDLFAQTAQTILDTLVNKQLATSSETLSRKFQNSQFLQLMSKISQKNVVIQDGELVNQTISVDNTSDSLSKPTNLPVRREVEISSTRNPLDGAFVNDHFRKEDASITEARDYHQQPFSSNRKNHHISPFEMAKEFYKEQTGGKVDGTFLKARLWEEAFDLNEEFM